ncbi:TolC family protein, partial [Pararobbsia alpina]|uniref:Outer membrane protein OprJ n=1 Tax=Pararobbsia alpina TaxID=621374 RepID=A0A6S7B8T8_9BURK
MTASSLFWSLGPSIVGTVFDGGQHEANLRGANAQYDMAVADYRQTVLTAFQQVEDGLSAARVLSQEAQSQQSAVDASGQALDRAMNRFKDGAISYLDVVNLQAMALTDSRMAVDIEKRRMDADVQLLEALGGGWKAPA